MRFSRSVISVSSFASALLSRNKLCASILPTPPSTDALFGKISATKASPGYTPKDEPSCLDFSSMMYGISASKPEDFDFLQRPTPQLEYGVSHVRHNHGVLLLGSSSLSSLHASLKLVVLLEKNSRILVPLLAAILFRSKLLPDVIQTVFQAMVESDSSHLQEAAALSLQRVGRTQMKMGLGFLKPSNPSTLFWTKPTSLLLWYTFYSSLLDLVLLIRESNVFVSNMVRSYDIGVYPLNPGQVFPVQRCQHHASSQAFAFQTAIKRTFIGLLEAVFFWSLFEKCEAILVKHLDPIVEDVVLGDYHRSSMLFEYLSFPALLSVLIITVVLNLPFEDLEEFISIICNET